MSWTRWKGLLALAVLTSITGNVMHAVLVAPTVYGWGAAVAASIAPVFLFWHTHNLITAPVGSRRGDWVGAAVISMIALGAFAVSFMGLRELLITFGFAPAIAVILPLVVDVTIAGAGWELVREDRGTGVADHSVDRPVIPTDQQVITAPDHPIIEPITLDQTIDLPLIGAGQVGDQQSAGELHPVISETSAEVPMHLVEPAGDQPDDHADPLDDHRELAELIAATGRTIQPINVITAVLAARAAGKGQKAAGVAAGVSQGTAKKIEDLATEVAA
ncbi:Protein of uncharacterised function (DUF2637) (plasmid) [Tsukamurella tyrosinosolvens]|uniref:DUF2637 domain-containing protein n=2 Tax=Tsukamurella tyrosinosolvens TaxID=57704 RepID=A0A1H4I711_TSUTY|nr:hypothetical protein AXK58_19390 [Tsukamurella tyrosinosolvens]SEB29546.1 Protein of unknown function [Tsukamurella tyrosinosolvens]VEH95888.1 Protein of uncharacterised function (DUF2637) [Tsukamurella tyrosinosolvens]